MLPENEFIDADDLLDGFSIIAPYEDDDSSYVQDRDSSLWESLGDGGWKRRTTSADASE